MRTCVGGFKVGNVVASSITRCQVTDTVGFPNAVGNVLACIGLCRFCLVRCRSGFHRSPTLAGTVADIIASWQLGDSIQVCHLSESIYHLENWEQNKYKSDILDMLHHILLQWVGAGPSYLDAENIQSLRQVSDHCRIKAPALNIIDGITQTRMHTRARTCACEHKHLCL